MRVEAIRLQDLIRVHYGKALKKADRDETGSHSVFGSSGEVGKHSQRLVDYPTLIVGRKGSVGAVTYAPEGGWPIDTAFYIERLEPSELDLRYLFYALRRCHLEDRVITTSIPGLSRDDIYSAKIPLPPLPEQRRIAAILDKADAVRRKRQKTLDLADQFLRSAFLDMFGDPKQSPFPVVTLEEACTRITDGAHKTPTYSEAGIPFLRVTDIQDKEIDWAKVKRIPPEEHKALTRRCHPEEGDVLYSKNGTVGIPRVVDWEQPFSTFVSLALLKPDRSRIRGSFLESFLGTPHALRQATAHSKTLTVTNLHLVEIRKIRMPLPPIEVQDRWLELKEQTRQATARHQEAHDAVRSLFQSLVQHAFRGGL